MGARRRDDDEGFLTARQAAAYVGYEPGVDVEGRPLPPSQDKAVRAFYAWVRRHNVPTFRRDTSTLLFRKSDLTDAVQRVTADYRDEHESEFERMGRLGRAIARGERG